MTSAEHDAYVIAKRQTDREFLVVTVLLTAVLILLLFLAGVRDNTVTSQPLPRTAQIDCVAERYAAGATSEMALRLCGGPDAEGLERDLP